MWLLLLVFAGDPSANGYLLQKESQADCIKQVNEMRIQAHKDKLLIKGALVCIHIKELKLNRGYKV